jgi:hypothetical protein
MLSLKNKLIETIIKQVGESRFIKKPEKSCGNVP